MRGGISIFLTAGDHYTAIVRGAGQGPLCGGVPARRRLRRTMRLDNAEEPVRWSVCAYLEGLGIVSLQLGFHGDTHGLGDESHMMSMGGGRKSWVVSLSSARSPLAVRCHAAASGPLDTGVPCVAAPPWAGRAFVHGQDGGGEARRSAEVATGSITRIDFTVGTDHPAWALSAWQCSCASSGAWSALSGYGEDALALW